MRILQSLNIGAVINVGRGIAFSEDDKISVITAKSIYVYDLVADPVNTRATMNLELNYVKNSEEVNPWQLNLGIDRSVLLEDCSKDDQGIIILDKVVSPHMESGKTAFRQFVKAEWTKDFEEIRGEKLRKSGSCLITLTSDHWLRVFGQTLQDNEWEVFCDVSEKIHNYLKKNVWDKKAEKSTKLLRARAYDQATITFLWVPEVKLFFASQKSGRIFVMDSSLNIIKDIDNKGKEVSVLSYVVLKDESLLLIAAEQEGSVKGYVIKRDTSVCQLKNDIWTDSDRVQISSIQIVDRDSERVRILIAKGNHLLYVNIHGDDISIEDPLYVGSSHVNDIQKLDRSDHKVFLVMSLSGNLYILKDREIEEIYNIEGLDTKHYTNHGLGRSRNSALIVILQTVSAYHDHLVLRTSSKVTFFTEIRTHEEAFSRANKDFSSSIDLVEAGRMLYLKSDEARPVDKELLTDNQFRLWYNRFFSNMGITVAEEKENEDICREILKLYADKEKLDSLDSTLRFKYPSKDWRCSFCEKECSESSSFGVICASNHTLPRCVLSLKLMTDSVILKCRWCRSLASLESNPNLIIKCPLCGGQYDYK